MPKYYWTLIIEESWVQSAIWSVEGSSIKIVSQSNPVYWDEASSLLTSVDSCLSSCVQDFPEEQEEPSKVVFGVPASWVSGGQIISDYLEKIRILCSKLSLEPSGFVVLPEAVAYFVKSQEGSPLSGIVLGIGSATLEVSLFKLGNLVGSIAVSRSVSVVDDLIEGLARFKVEDNLPSRILIFDGKSGELEEVRNQLLGADWIGGQGGKVKFLHAPKVEIVDSREKILAVTLAGASEIAGSVTIAPEESRSVEVEEEVEDGIGETARPEELGFSLGQDIGVASIPPPVSAKAPLREKPKVVLPKIGLPKLWRGFPLWAWMGVVFVVLSLFVGVWWFLPRAVVTIYLSPKRIEKEETVLIDFGSAGSDDQTPSLSGTVLTETLTGEKTMPTTGRRTVGEKAKGRVQIRNGTSSIVKLPAGSVISGAADLRFTLDSSASVSAAVSPSSPGTATVSVSASEIGSQYNLAKGEIFSVSNYPRSEVDAVSEDNFSGGSSREVSAVSQEDQDKLEESLLSELLDEAKKKLSERQNSDQILVENVLVQTKRSVEFSHKIGDEADTLKLNLTSDISGVLVSREALNSRVREILASDVPSGFVLRDDQVKLSFDLLSVEEGSWTVAMRIEANLLPEVDTLGISKKIRGKYPKIAREYLSTTPGYVRSEMKINPLLPGPLGTLPRVLKNISIEISSEK